MESYNMKQPQEYKIEDDDELQEKLQEEKTQTFQAPKIRLKPYIPVIVKGIGQSQCKLSKYLFLEIISYAEYYDQIFKILSILSQSVRSLTLGSELDLLQNISITSTKSSQLKLTYGQNILDIILGHLRNHTSIFTQIQGLRVNFDYSQNIESHPKLIQITDKINELRENKESAPLLQTINKHLNFQRYGYQVRDVEGMSLCQYFKPSMIIIKELIFRDDFQKINLKNVKQIKMSNIPFNEQTVNFFLPFLKMYPHIILNINFTQYDLFTATEEHLVFFNRIKSMKIKASGFKQLLKIVNKDVQVFQRLTKLKLLIDKKSLRQFIDVGEKITELKRLNKLTISLQNNKNDNIQQDQTLKASQVLQQILYRGQERNLKMIQKNINSNNLSDFLLELNNKLFSGIKNQISQSKLQSLSLTIVSQFQLDNLMTIFMVNTKIRNLELHIIDSKIKPMTGDIQPVNCLKSFKLTHQGTGTHLFNIIFKKQLVSISRIELNVPLTVKLFRIISKTKCEHLTLSQQITSYQKLISLSNIFKKTLRMQNSLTQLKLNTNQLLHQIEDVFSELIQGLSFLKKLSHFQLEASRLIHQQVKNLFNFVSTSRTLQMVVFKFKETFPNHRQIDNYDIAAHTLQWRQLLQLLHQSLQSHQKINPLQTLQLIVDFKYSRPLKQLKSQNFYKEIKEKTRIYSQNCLIDQQLSISKEMRRCNKRLTLMLNYVCYSTDVLKGVETIYGMNEPIQF